MTCPAGTVPASPAAAAAGDHPGGLRVHRFESLADVPQDLWESLAGSDSLYVCEPWTKALGRSNPALPIVFWAVADSEGWIAGIPVHLFDAAPPSPTYSPWGLHPGLADDADLVRALPHALVGTRNGQGNGLLRSLTRRPSEAAFDEAVAVLVSGIRAGHPDRVIAWTYAPMRFARRVSAALPNSVVLFADVTAEIPLPGPGADFADHLAALRGSSRRRVRADLKLIEAVGGVATPEVDPAVIEALCDDLAPLLGNVMRRHGHEPDVPALARYLRACAVPELSPALFTVRSGGRIVAFSLCVRHGEEMSVRVVGLDHAALEERDAMDYAHVSVHGPVEHALRIGVRRIDLGVGTLDAKLMRGARPRALATVVALPAASPHRLAPGLERTRLPLLTEQSRVMASLRPEEWDDLEI
ncbi:GNAT family N-acetyltransferase [Streptomyces sp. NRRL S-448]|uniref:GNAT family N-acetyltransferase n=1 Tax=Streptomyces sp. NRRL S-448 TaxID=1463907 RepID=UPI000B0F3A82